MTTDLKHPELKLRKNWLEWLKRADFSQLEAILPQLLLRSRWFGGKARAIAAAHINLAFPLSADETRTLFVVEVRYVAGGGSEAYHVLLALVRGPAAEAVLAQVPAAVVASVVEADAGAPALLVDALALPDFCRSLLSLLLPERALRSDGVSLRGEASPWLRASAALDQAPLEPRPLGAEQSNSSLIFGEKLILKLYRKAERGRRPDLELGRFLTEQAAFAGSPRVAGWLEYVRGAGPASSLAIVHEYATGTRDAWRVTLDELAHYFNTEALGTFPKLAALLGRRTAELHLALSSDSASAEMAPEPYDAAQLRALHQSLRQLAQSVLQQLRQSLALLPADARNEAAAVLSAETRVFSCFDALEQCELTATTISDKSSTPGQTF